jgi:hypothetical protein
MKYTVEGLKQTDLCSLKLTICDAIILSFIIKNKHIYNLNNILNNNPILRISEIALKKRIKKYINMGLLQNNTEFIVDLLKEKSLYSKNNGIGECVCEWCQIKTVILHKHHYPIAKKDNGKQIINICPNCHSEFHNYINYEPSKKLEATYVEKKENI